MSKITIETAANGWTLLPEDGFRLDGGAANQARKVARTSKELAALVEDWADAKGKPFDKRPPTA